ncbi:MAG: hypothetical protein VKK94_02165 [Cyanobacteriota bacterium]|nr:hypothetical protein [Cyanobacteriota bacterium]
MDSLSSEQRDDLQAFIKDWLRHAGRTQADLRRALQAGSIRMPVLIDALASTYAQGGINGLAARLCAIEDRWQEEDDRQDANAEADDPFGQLDLLLREIRMDPDA